MRPADLDRLEAVLLERNGKRRGKELRFTCPVHDDENPSADWNKDKDAWICRACDAKGNSAQLAELFGLEISSKASAGRRRHVVSTRKFEIKDQYEQVLGVHVRKDDSDGGKEIYWERANGTKGLGGLRVESLPFYGTEKLAELPDGSRVVLCEGEKAQEALMRRGVTAVGSVTGAAVIPVDDRLRPLLRFDVLLWPDNDMPGERHMVRIAERLTLMGKTPRFVRWPQAPEGGDAADFDGDDLSLNQLLTKAERWQADDLATPLPQAELAAWLDEIVAFVRRYVVLDEHQRCALALWIAHSYVFSAFDATPYLLITSAEKRSGKTRLLEVIDLLVRGPWMTGRVTGALLARKIARDAPTLLLDENDAAFNGPREYVEVLRQVLNMGHRKSGVCSVLVPSGHGSWDTEDLPVFCPKALAGIGSLPDTVLDRGIRLVLSRRAVTEEVQKFRPRKVEQIARPIRQALERWAPSAIERLRDAEPILPEELDDRAQDGWEPLVAIADMAGGGWPIKARATAVALSGAESRGDESLGVRLLSDIRDVFQSRNVDRIFSAVLALALCEIEEAPWGSLRYGALNAAGLAQRLKPYEIRPKQIRISDTTKKGYERTWFEEAWRRYLPGLSTGETGETSETEPENESANASDSVSEEPSVSATGAKHGDRSETEARVESNLFEGRVSDVSPVSPPGHERVNGDEPAAGTPDGASCSQPGCFAPSAWISAAGKLALVWSAWPSPGSSLVEPRIRLSMTPEQTVVLQPTIYCPYCRTDAPRDKWRTILRRVLSAGSNQQPIRVVRHMNCNQMAYALLE